MLNTNYMALKIENILKSMIERIKIREEFLWLSGNGQCRLANTLLAKLLGVKFSLKVT